jgi:hypothetical protein
MPMSAELKIINSHPELVLDGQVQTRMWSRPDLPAYLVLDKIDEVAHAGINIHLVSLHQPQLLCWDGGAHYDYHLYEGFVREIVGYQPDARLILYVGIRTAGPYKWVRDNPDQRTLMSSGHTIDAPSIASKRWHTDSAEAVRRLVRHFDHSDLRNHVIGYNFVMAANEWFAYGAYHKDPLGRGFADYSEVFRTHYQAWLRKRYQDDEKALRASWRDPNATFDTAAVPRPEERLCFGHEGQFFPAEHFGNRLVDYYHCWHEAWADMALLWCRTAKETSTKPILCGLMNGYSYCGAHVPSYPPVSNYGGALKLLNSPHIDFLQAPYHYYNRSFPGTHYGQHAEASVHLHGKLLLDQLDTKTHLKNNANTNAKTSFETRQVLLRDVANSVARNFHSYWMDIHRGVFAGFGGPEPYEPLHFDDPQIKAQIAQLKRLTDENQRLATTSISEVSLFTSKEAAYRMNPQALWTLLHVDAFRQWVLPHLGTAFDDYIFEDFENVQRDYKLYLFPNATYIPSALRQRIRDRIEAGATALFFYAPGYLDERGGSLQNIHALTGLELAISPRTDWLQVTLEQRSHPLLAHPDGTTDDWWESPRREADGGRSFGSDIDTALINKTQEWLQFPGSRNDYRFNPIFHCTDSQATVLGRLRGTDEVGLAVKKLGRGQVVYSAAPLLPASILRNIAASAGVHLHAPDGSLVYANSRYLFAMAARAGQQVLRLPRRTDIFDALTNEPVARNTTDFTYDAAFGEARMFRLGE